MNHYTSPRKFPNINLFFFLLSQIWLQNEGWSQGSRRGGSLEHNIRPPIWEGSH